MFKVQLQAFRPNRKPVYIDTENAPSEYFSEGCAGELIIRVSISPDMEFSSNVREFLKKIDELDFCEIETPWTRL